jgi:excisionase family DNA binding protein
MLDVRLRSDCVVTDRLLDANEIADLLNVPVSWVRESTRSGAMPCVELGGYRRYDLAGVERWLESCKQPGRSIALRRRRAT